MENKYFSWKDDGVIIAHCRGNVEYDMDHAISELNSLENIRRDHKKKIEKLQDELSLYRTMMDGLCAYYKLKCKDHIYPLL